MTKLGLVPLLLATALPLGGRWPTFAAPRGTTPAAPVTTPVADPPAAASVAVSTMSVQIWPEYDDPGVLLIYDGELAPTVKVPTVFSFLIPQGARMNMVGGVAADGHHVHADYTTKDLADGVTEVTYSLTVPHFYMEFYYDPFTGGARRDFTYSIVSPYAVDTLTVAVQQPRRAQGFMVTPYTREMSQDKDGFLYYVIKHDSVAAGASEPVSVTYTKQDDKPSVEPRQAGSATATPSSGPRWSARDIPLLASLLLAAGAAVAFFHSRRDRQPWDDDGPDGPDSREMVEGSAAPAEPERHRHRSATRSPGTRRFCTACGAFLQADDRYCGACGHPARSAGARGASPIIASSPTT